MGLELSNSISLEFHTLLFAESGDRNATTPSILDKDLGLGKSVIVVMASRVTRVGLNNDFATM